MGISLISNPPYNLKWTVPDLAGFLPQYSGYEIPPASNANMAFVLSALNWIEDRAVLLLPNGVLSSGQKQEQTIRKQQEYSEQQSKMITAMASDYRCVYYVTLDTDEGICYRTDHAFDNAISVDEHFRFSERFTAYAEKYVAEQYREGFLRFIDPDTIRQRLSGELIISYRYLQIMDGQEKSEMLRMAGVRRPEDRDDHIVHAIGVGFTDIDQEMRETLAKNEALSDALKAAEEANRAKTAFLNNMSHEIRTPMNAIIGLNSIAMNDPETPEKTREYLARIDSSA